MRIRQVAPMCFRAHGRAHWRHVANAIEPSVCCSDAALCQITLTTCIVSYTKMFIQSVTITLRLLRRLNEEGKACGNIKEVAQSVVTTHETHATHAPCLSYNVCHYRLMLR